MTVSIATSTSHGRTPWLVRAARASDRDAVRAFLGRLSERTVQARYLHPSMRLTGPVAERELHRLLGRDDAAHVVVVALDGTGIHGIGEFLREQADRADLGVVVEDAFQRRGIGQLLFRALEQRARERGIRIFTGDMAYGNTRAVALLRETGQQLRMQAGGGGVHFTLLLAADGHTTNTGT